MRSQEPWPLGLEHWLPFSTPGGSFALRGHPECRPNSSHRKATYRAPHRSAVISVPRVGRSSGMTVRPLQSTRALSITFSSSLTFPGHEYEHNALVTSGSTSRIPHANFSANRFRKCATRNGMSSRRSLRGGTSIRTTLSLKKRSARNRPASTSSFRCLVGCSHYADIHLYVFVSANSLKLMLLQHSQQLHLEVQ